MALDMQPASALRRDRPMLIDVHHLLRSLRRSPVSAAAAVLTLALTLGAATSIFAVVDAVLLTPPPFADPDRLATVGETPVDEPTSVPRAVPYATFEAWRQRAGSLAAIEAYDSTNLTLTELGGAERVSVSDVTPGFLTVLGVSPSRGRLFEANDVGRPLAIVSHGFWRAKLAADPAAIGREVILGGRAHTIVGILPEQFAFALNRSDVWRPLQLQPGQDGRALFQVRVVARLAGKLSSRDLRAALDDVSRSSSPPARVVVTGMAGAIAGAAARTLGLLAGAAAFAFLIAFANLAALLLVRSIDRRRELAVRTALGARPSEVARQLVLEAETLVALGIAGGVLLAFWLTPAAARLAVEQFGAVANREVAVSWRVIGVVTVVATAFAAICGLLPAAVASRHDVARVLRGGVTPAPRELGLRRLFVIGEVALACVLLVSLTLVGRSLQAVLEVSPGFDARGLLTLQVSVPAASYPTPDRVASFYSTLNRSLEARLGPGTVSMVSELPLTGDRGRRLARLRPSDAGREAVARAAGRAYFEVMRIPTVAGRPFDARDNTAAPPRVVVSESLADSLFGRQQAIGRQIRVGANAPAAEIIGVVGDVKHRALDEGSLPTVYLSADQAPSRSSILVVRSPRPDADVVATVRDAVARLDRDLPVYRVRSMHAVVAASPGLPARRVLTATFMGFALLAAILGGIGLFGVVGHDVASRRVELAIRIALGAAPMRIVMGPIGQAALMVGAGLAIGGVLSIGAARALGGMLFATGRFDLLNVGVAAVVLVVVGAVAVLPAAWRAARTDPVSALRRE
jgi:putative ABC transport system permease protein